MTQKGDTTLRMIARKPNVERNQQHCNTPIKWSGWQEVIRGEPGNGKDPDDAEGGRNSKNHNSETQRSLISTVITSTKLAPKTCSKYYTVFKYILQQNLKKNVKFSLWNSFNFRNFKCHKKVNFEGLLLHLPIASLSYYCSEIDKCWEVNLSSLFLVGGQKQTWMKIPNHAEWRDNAVPHPFTETMISIFNA